MTDAFFNTLSRMENSPKEPAYVEKIRDLLMIAIPPTLLGSLSALDRLATDCLARLNDLPWKDGRPGC